ncbi:hypothetical protein H0I76_00130 [Limibaculum sp. M0105]|uniref:Uncharacterized protein n=1 Tax=Thermohalobaculum xanthum TaxID=2753746 RepID=A0A8J7M4P7_9RHOB|nr:hypothetical protein [Thermohalobaculum xanthum]MBK0397582.1 hypothetical protein [Thermohalobaculum xanthum]
MPDPVRVPVGWRNSSPQAALAFFPPEPVGREAAGSAPGLVAAGLEDRLVRLRAPFDLRLRLSHPKAQPPQLGRVPRDSSLSEEGFRALVTPIKPSAQRDATTLAVQLALNLFFVCDEECTIQLMPPFLSENYRHWPGPIVCGRFPLKSWPRPLNAVLEWQDRDRDWVIRRGDDLAYVMFSFDDPAKLPALSEAALTPALRRHVAQVDNVSSFGRNVGPMFAEAERRRPARLMVPKRIGCPN